MCSDFEDGGKIKLKINVDFKKVPSEKSKFEKKNIFIEQLI